MKQLKLMLLIGVTTFGFAAPAFTQEILPEVTLYAVRYKYLLAAGDNNSAQPVKLLQQKAAAYDVKNSEYYEDEYDTYFISFFIPDGQILAAYDKDGKLVRTAEKFKNVALPPAVSKAVVTRFPNWKVSKDVYLVNYYEPAGAKKVYKLLLENGKKRIKVKTNEDGEFI